MFRHLNSLLSDINECTANVHHCDDNAFCNNTEGCSPGYDGNGTSCTGKLLYFNPLIFFILFNFNFNFSFSFFLFSFCFCLFFVCLFVCFFWGGEGLKYVSAAVLELELCFVDPFCPRHL